MIITSRPILSLKNILDLFFLLFKRSKNLKSKNNFAINGSSALIYILKNLNIKKGSKILIPSLICESIPQILKSNNFEVQYYEHNIDGSINHKNLKNFIQKKKIKAIVLVNYFGLNYLYNLKIAKNLRETKCKLIHDFSHTYEINTQNDEFDGIFFSLKKTLPVPSLGVFRTKNEIFKHYKVRLTHKDIMYLVLYLIINFFKNISYFNKKFVNLNRINLKSKNTDIDRIYKINLLTYSFLNSKKRLNKILFLRKKNYYYIKKLCKLNNQKLIFNNFHKNFLPQAFTILNSDNRLFNKIKNEGFKIFRWPGEELPEYIKKSKGYKKTKFLNNNIICIPIHELVENRDIDKLMTIIKKHDK